MAPDSEDEDNVRTGPKILVVEDHEFVRMHLVSHLDSADYQVVEAGDGASGLEALAKNNDISLAVIDVRMDPMDGFEMVRKMNGTGSDVPVIFITGDRSDDIIEQAEALNVKKVMTKPVRKDDMIDEVKNILSK